MPNAWGMDLPEPPSTPAEESTYPCEICDGRGYLACSECVGVDGQVTMEFCEHCHEERTTWCERCRRTGRML